MTGHPDAADSLAACLKAERERERARAKADTREAKPVARFILSPWLAAALFLIPGWIVGGMLIRACQPEQGAWTVLELDEQRRATRIWSAHAEPETRGTYVLFVATDGKRLFIESRRAAILGPTLMREPR